MARELPAPLRGPALGLLVPCRDEALVIERKLRNLARSEWPPAARAHRVVVVDDGSRDGTGERARALLRGPEWPAAIAAEVIANTLRPGKGGAIESGLRHLGDSVDLLLLSDADVVFEPSSLRALTAAFERDPRLVMACGAQRYVEELRADGTTDPGGLPTKPAGSTYDRLSSWVRRAESRAGALFSVHGQMLAWRAELGIAPARGLAADDLELMLAARTRAQGGRIELVPGARFLELKTPPGPAARAQALRRARAYVQLVREHPAPPGAPLRRLQWSFYRRVPLAFPWLCLASLAALLIALLLAPAPLVPALALGAALALTFLDGLAELALIIHRATRLEARERQSDRWEMARR